MLLEASKIQPGACWPHALTERAVVATGSDGVMWLPSSSAWRTCLGDTHKENKPQHLPTATPFGKPVAEILVRFQIWAIAKTLYLYLRMLFQGKISYKLLGTW